MARADRDESSAPSEILNWVPAVAGRLRIVLLVLPWGKYDEKYLNVEKIFSIVGKKIDRKIFGIRHKIFVAGKTKKKYFSLVFPAGRN